MNHRRTILLLGALGLAGAIAGGCDMSDMSGMNQSMGVVSRAEYDRALADAKQQRAEAARQQAEAQKWQAQAAQDRQLVEQIRGETGKIFETLREEGQAKSDKVPALQQANEDLVTRIQGLGKRVRDLEADLSRAVQEYKSLQEENRQLRADKVASTPPAAANPPAGGSVVVSGVVARPVTTSPAAPLSAAQQERQRLFAAAAKELGEAKAALGGAAATGELVGAASRPAESASPGLAGAVTEARGAKVKIALGARNGLRSDTRMYVHRGSQFIGVLQLTTIEDQTAEGVVDGRMSANVGDQAVVFGD